LAASICVHAGIRYLGAAPSVVRTATTVESSQFVATRVATNESQAGVPAARTTSAEAEWRIDEKYGAWLDQTRLGIVDRERIRPWLVERESVANDYELHNRDSRLARLDAQLLAALHPTDFARYEQIKDADESLQALENFRQGLAHTQPLSDPQMTALIDAKLRQTWLAKLSPQSAPEALRQFILEAAATLTAGQLQQLNDFERTEFERSDAGRAAPSN
jgi:hypothetical protein